MISSQITTADVSLLTGYSRHQLRGLIQALPGFKRRGKSERVAVEYTPKELIILTICCELESKFGLRRDVISNIVGNLQNVLSGPRMASDNSRLLINTTNADVEYIEGVCEVAEGIVFPLQDIFRGVDNYLNNDSSYRNTAQKNLDYGPVAIQSTIKQNKTTASCKKPGSSANKKSGTHK